MIPKNLTDKENIRLTLHVAQEGRGEERAGHEISLPCLATIVCVQRPGNVAHHTGRDPLMYCSSKRLICETVKKTTNSGTTDPKNKMYETESAPTRAKCGFADIQRNKAALHMECKQLSLTNDTLHRYKDAFNKHLPTSHFKDGQDFFSLFRHFGDQTK